MHIRLRPCATGSASWSRGNKLTDVLSDDAIVDMLKGKGVEIARRTVAKYREGMNIPSSVQRRREKQMLASVGR